MLEKHSSNLFGTYYILLKAHLALFTDSPPRQKHYTRYKPIKAHFQI